MCNISRIEECVVTNNCMAHYTDNDARSSKWKCTSAKKTSMIFYAFCLFLLILFSQRCSSQTLIGLPGLLECHGILLLVPIHFPPVGFSMQLLDKGRHPYISTGLGRKHFESPCNCRNWLWVWYCWLRGIVNNHSLESDGQDPNCCSPKTNYLVRTMRTWIMPLLSQDLWNGKRGRKERWSC